MKNIPQEFYYLQSDEQQQYSAIPSGGAIDSDKLRQKDPNFWVSRTLNEALKPKHLIIHDFFAAHREEHQKLQLRRKLYELIRQGFPLFLWKMNQFISLNNDNLHEIHEGKEPTFPDTIIHHGVKTHRFTKDSMMILDDYWISQILLDQKTLQPRALYTSLWTKLSNYYQKKVLQILAVSKPKMAQWIQDVFPELPISDTMNLPILRQYQLIDIDAKTRKKTINDLVIAERVKIIFRPSFATSIDVLIPFSSKIKSFHVTDNYLSPTLLKKLLCTTPYLETLDLSGWNIFDIYTKPFGLKAKCLPSLSWLNLSMSKITVPYLKELIQAAPGVETLNISYCGKLGIEPFGLKAGSLVSLSSISSRKGCLSAQQLKELLEAAPHLQILNLSDCKTYDGDLGTAALGLKANSLLSLKSLGLQGSFINAPQLKELLLAATHLQELDLSSSMALASTTSTLALEAGSLPSLKLLSLATTPITAPQLKELLLAATNLQELDLSSAAISMASTTLALEAGSLPSLKLLNLATSLITAQQLTELLKAAVHLETLNLCGTKHLGTSSLKLSKRSLPSLKSLKLDETTTIVHFKELLHATCHLEQLTFTGVRRKSLGSDSLALESGSLSSLKSLMINGSTLIAQQLNELLSAAPHLQILNLHFCKNLGTDPFGLKAKSLPKLKYANLQNSILTSLQLKEFLNAAPHLKTLNLRRLQTTGSASLEMSAKSLPLLKSFYLHLNASPSELKSFLEAASNLEELQLLLCNSLSTGSWNLQTESLLSLKSLSITSDITKLRLTNLQLKVLLSAAPHLEELYLNSPLDAGPLALKPGSLLSLKQLTINSIITTQLREMLTASPNLKTLHCDGLRNLENASFKLTAKSLLSLKELHLSNIDITTQQLKELLSASPHLEEIFLHKCTANLASLELPERSLLSLRIIKTDQDLNPVQLKKLQCAAPNVTIPREEDDFRLPGQESDLRSLKPSELSTQSKEGEITAETNKLIDLDPIHNSQEYLTHTIKKPQDFHYTTALSSHNQMMIIAKLSQYLMTTDPKQYKTLVLSIQDGICTNLSLYFVHNPKHFHEFFKRIIDWMPLIDPQPPKALQDDFKQLLKYVKETGRSQNYLGSHWEPFIKTSKKPFVLYNPWHAIALRPPVPPTLTWTIYDPNYVNGPKDISDKDLKQAIINALGDMNLSVESEVMMPTPPPIISNLDQFLAEGGLLTLNKVNNWRVPVSLCQQGKFSPEALSHGLLIRNVYGIPAWIKGKNHPVLAIRTLTQQLLEQYASIFPDFKAFESTLEQSLNHLSPAELKAPPGLFLELNPSSPIETAVSALVHRTAKKKALQEYSSQYFQAQNDPKTQDYNLTQYYQHLLTSTGHTLVSCSSEEDSRSLQLHLQQKSSDYGQATYLINSPEDLLCGSDFIDAQGILRKGPGGPLYEFLKKYRDQTPTLLINYDAFKDSDFARFNAILDTEPSIDGVFFHQLFNHHAPNSLIQDKTKLRVIGFRNSANPNCYNESDFISRMPHQYKAPEKVPQLPQLLASTSISAGDAVINLFKSPDWETELLGQWIPEGERFYFKEGELERVLKTNPKRLVLLNGFESNTRYQAFWQKALILGVITHQGRHIDLPKDLQIVTQQGYEWSALKPKSLTCYRGHGPGHVINPTRFNDLFKRYRCINEQLQEWEGLIETAQKTAEKRLNLYISRNLSKDQWAKLLTKTTPLHLTLYLAENVVLPQESGLKLQQGPQPQAPHAKDQIHPECTSQEAQKQIQRLKQEAKKPLIIIDVSERQASDLITRLTLKDPESSTMSFQEQEGALIKALSDDETVILKGHITPVLMDELQVLLHQRRHDATVKGRLILMPTTITPQSDLSVFKTLSNVPPEHLNAHEFIKGRIDACNAVLKNNPYVFLSGLSGVGKTSFVENEFCGPKKHTLHTSIESWITTSDSGHDDQYHILFIDEATLSKRDFTEFNDLFNTPPTFLYQSTLHRLTPKHKVVFAGNPLSYGEGRVLASLFQEHGHAVVFAPLPQSVIEERILSPVFVHSSLTESDIALIQEHLFKVYHRLCSYSKERILISPRELQMMALLTQSYCIQYPESNPKDVAIHCAYQIAAPLVPVAYQNEFECFKPDIRLNSIKPVAPKPSSSFCLTGSREHIAQTLNQLMLLREQRRQTKSTANAAQLYGGLGGLIFEGDPGVGKSEMLIHLLRDWGLEEIPCYSEPQQSKNIFYRIPAEYSIKQKKSALKHAFHEGAVVIMDEINSSTMLEQFLNHLLMGKDDEGQRPQNPGFTLLGTQNPATFSARRQASEALSRRLHTIQVPEYSVQELIQILKTKGLVDEDATIMSQLWKQAYDEAQATHQKLPTFRDLIHITKHWLRVQKQKERMQESKQQVLDAINQLRSFKEDTLLQHYLDKMIEEEGYIPEQQFKTILQLTQLQQTVHTLCQTLLVKDNHLSWWHQLFFTNATQKATNISNAFRQIPVQERLKLLDYSTLSFDEDSLPNLEAFITHLEEKRFIFGMQASHSSRFFKQQTDQIRNLEVAPPADESLIL